ncbi:MAG: TetR/AcrR family transcriptional regulator [Gemmatimonadales bacterium]
MKDAILTAAISVLADDGLNNWTIEEVAERARCAKGLVNYHYRSKLDLLTRAANALRDDRHARRLAALQAPGTAALDRLWQVLLAEVESGWFAAWLAMASAEGPLRQGASGWEGRALAQAASKALGVDLPPDSAYLIPGLLDGLELQLLLGVEPGAVEEAYHRAWTVVLGAGF